MRTEGKRGGWAVGALLLGLSILASVGWAGPSVFHVQIDGFSPYYVPRSVKVPAGATVMWENPTATHHTITHDGCRTSTRCMFDSGPIVPDGQFALYGLPPGIYSYHCLLHPVMTGTLIVTDNSIRWKT